MKFIWWFIAVSAVLGFSFNVGREYQRIKSKRQADEIHASIKRFVDASGKLRAAIGAVKQAGTAGDSVAKGPLPIKRGEADRALKNGEIAFYKDSGGSC